MVSSNIQSAEQSLDALDGIVGGKVRPRLVRLLSEIAADGQEARFVPERGDDRRKVFAGEADPFLSGALVQAAGFLAGQPGEDGLDTDQIRRLLALVTGAPHKTWGILFALRGLLEFNRLGLMEEVFSGELLADLRARLTPDDFLDPATLNLIGRTPTNYHGVALGIRLCRAALGWEDSGAVEQVLERVSRVFASSGSGIADETEGGGRFDRYSFFLPFDFAGHFIAVGQPVPPAIREHMRPTMAALLMRTDPDGRGIEYGRSLGPHGEVPLAGAMAIAASCAMLPRAQLAPAARHSVVVARRYADFWWSDTLGSVNYWEDGRSTDRYRGLHRMLSEDLLLGIRLLWTQRIWRAAQARFASLPEACSYDPDPPPVTGLSCHVLRFTPPGLPDERALITVREPDGYWGLPLVSGGRANHRRSDYLPIPYRHGLVVGAPMFGGFPQLVPRLLLEDSTEAMPTVFFRDITCTSTPGQVRVTYALPSLCVDRNGHPEIDSRWQATTRYDFAPGRIARRDSFTLVSDDPAAGVASLSMVFASMASIAEIAGPQRVDYRADRLTSFETVGFSRLEQVDHATSKAFRTPTGRYGSVIRLTAEPAAARFSCGWTLTYRPDAS